MSGINAKVTPEVVASMRNMRNHLEDLSNQMKAEISKLEDAYLENKDKLGPHSEEIGKLLEDLGAAADEADVPVKTLRRKLFKSAALRDNMISNNPYGRSR